MSRSVTSREKANAKSAAYLARPIISLDSALDASGQMVSVGDTVEFAPGRTTKVTSITQEPTSSAAYDLAVADVTNTMVGRVYVSMVKKVS